VSILWFVINYISKFLCDNFLGLWFALCLILAIVSLFILQKDLSGSKKSEENYLVMDHILSESENIFKKLHESLLSGKKEEILPYLTHDFQWKQPYETLKPKKILSVNTDIINIQQEEKIYICVKINSIDIYGQKFEDYITLEDNKKGVLLLKEIGEKNEQKDIY
jgi:hypothetical protein